jgi:hypothetical protein
MLHSLCAIGIEKAETREQVMVRKDSKQLSGEDTQTKASCRFSPASGLRHWRLSVARFNTCPQSC